MGRLLPAWIISGIIHVALLSLFLFVTVSSSGAPEMELSVIETKVEDAPPDKNLTNEDIGNDPDLPTNYNVDRIEEASVPGPVSPNETVGILNAPEAPPQTIPPPAGFGSNSGQGGGIDDPTRTGAGGLYGNAGGVGGSKPGATFFGGRSGATREKMLRQGGGNTRSEAAVAAGLKWLARHQAVDGSWSAADFHLDGKCNCSGPGNKDRMFGTALALLPFLGAGETHKAVGKHSVYAKNVERAMKWMIAHQNADGVLSGNGYIEGLATLTLCELYALTADPMLKGPAQRAINAVVNWQGADGGFRYGPKFQVCDTSVTGWHVQALKSGQMAGLHVPNATLAGVNRFLDKVSTPDGSGVGYAEPRPSGRMTAVGLLCRQYMGWGPRHPGLAKGVQYLLTKETPTYKDIYFRYYATQVMHHFGGQAWDQWNLGSNGKPGMRDILVESQDRGQHPEHRDQKGSWDPSGEEMAGHFGRLGNTCLSLLTLEVYYRHLPLYRRALGAQKDVGPVRNGIK